MSQNASPSLFGWDFQVNAAIILFLENITDIQHIRLEGKTEDIELKLLDGHYIYSQAKSVNDPDDVSHVKDKLKAAISTLNNAANDPNCSKLIYITNSPDPFRIKSTMHAFYGKTQKDHTYLPELCKKEIDKILSKIPNAVFDKSRFRVDVFPFHTDNLDERYKIVKSSIEEFLDGLGRIAKGKSQKIMEIWQKDVFENGTMRNTSIVLTKAELIWPILALVTECRSDDELLNDLDFCDLDEITSAHKDLINNKIERFNLYTQVVSDYTNFTYPQGKEKLKAFIDAFWEKYKEEFESDNVCLELQEKLIRITLSNIINNRRLVSDIKKKVNL